MKSNPVLLALLAALAIELPASAQIDSEISAQRSGIFASAVATQPTEQSWFQIPSGFFKTEVSSSENLARITFTEPKFREGHFLFVQSYNVDVDERLMFVAGVNAFESGEEVYFEIERSQLEMFDSIAFKLFSGDPLDPRNNPNELSRPTTFNAYVHNAESRWAPPVAIPADSNLPPKLSSIIPVPPGVKPPVRLSKKGTKNELIGIEGKIDGYWIIYCCPNTKKVDGKSTGPWLKAKGKKPGCNLTVKIPGPLQPKPDELAPGECRAVSGLTTTSSSASYWQAPSQ